MTLAIEQFWITRQSQKEKQAASGRQDAGTRGEVTGGAHMAAMENLVAEILVSTGLPDLQIYNATSNRAFRTARPRTNKQSREAGERSGLDLPGYFRAQKNWDMLVLSEGRLVAAVEIKGQVGSIGNNANNRMEEVIGGAQDFWTAYREHRLGLQAPTPFLGYIFLLEDSPEVHTPISIKETFFEIDPIFKNDAPIGKSVSYADRYLILCRRLQLERLYTATCLLLATRGPGTRVSQPTAEATFRTFMASLIGHATAFVLSQP
ncbi:MAG: PaeR7I family type II restriction endonuclease [Anaerolineae bacterium]